MKPTKAALLLPLIFPALSACGAGTFGGNTYQGYIYEQTEIITASTTNPLSIPTTGNASYDGNAQFLAKGFSQEYFGDFHADVDFAARQLTGTVDNMKVTDGLLTLTPVSGDLTMTASVTGLNSFREDAFSGSYSGDIAGIPDYGTVSGNFRGVGADKMSLSLNGSNFYGGAWGQ